LDSFKRDELIFYEEDESDKNFCGYVTNL